MIEIARNTTTEPDWLNSWQRTVNLLTEILDVRIGAVMRIQGEDLKVFITSDTHDNPLGVGTGGTLKGSGSYCEAVIESRSPLAIHDATHETRWAGRPELELGLISYLGYPILHADGTVFGTLCIFDDKANRFGDRFDDLMRAFAGLIESHLALADLNTELQARGDELRRQTREIRALRALIPVCAWCKDVRDDAGYWHEVGHYLAMQTGLDVTHGVCPDCLVEHFPEEAQTASPSIARPSAVEACG